MKPIPDCHFQDFRVGPFNCRVILSSINSVVGDQFLAWGAETADLGCHPLDVPRDVPCFCIYADTEWEAMKMLTKELRKHLEEDFDE